MESGIPRAPADRVEKRQMMRAEDTLALVPDQRLDSKRGWQAIRHPGHQRV